MTVDNELFLDGQARIIALEYLVKKLLRESIAINAEDRDGNADAAVADAENFRQDIARDLRGATLPAVDPAMSDHLTDLVAGHIDRLLREMIDEF